MAQRNQVLEGCLLTREVFDKEQILLHLVDNLVLQDVQMWILEVFVDLLQHKPLFALWKLVGLPMVLDEVDHPGHLISISYLSNLSLFVDVIVVLVNSSDSRLHLVSLLDRLSLGPKSHDSVWRLHVELRVDLGLVFGLSRQQPRQVLHALALVGVGL